ncbi:MAG: hypothetical protein LIP23_04420 [Planctomycetes bacterium]|nr:hypothetical protein [Planctomycetota bacterium]
MQINPSARSAPQSNNAAKANIERQIKVLEDRKKKLQRQMSGGSSTPPPQGADLSQGSLNIGSQGKGGGGSGESAAPANAPYSSVATQMEAIGAATGKSRMAEFAPSRTAAPAYNGMDTVASATQNIAAKFRASNSGGGGGGGGGGAGNNREALMKRIEMIDLQIMTLRQQLASVEQSEVAQAGQVTGSEEVLPEAAQQDNAANPEAAALSKPAELPPTTVNKFGYVDGYV